MFISVHVYIYLFMTQRLSMFKFFSKKKTLGRVGLLFNHSHIRLVSDDATPIFHSHPAISPQEWGAALSELFLRHPIAHRQINITLAAGFYQQVQIDKPVVTEDEMAGAIAWAVKDFVTEPIHQLVMDYVDLPVPTQGQDRVSVTLVPRARIQSLVDAISPHAAIERITTEEFALARLFPLDDVTRVLLWQPTGSDLQLLVFRQRSVCFSRSLRGFKHLSSSALSPEELDTLALEVQRSLAYLQGQLKLPECGAMQVAISSPVLGDLVRHLEQAFSFTVSAMANPAILTGIDYLPAYAVLQERAE
ncbi:MSHA biogenesis protein MshI [Aeromonas simiae]|nr:MSHA biogenesis protein MshI [Aeromonas simiae]MDO2947638.1 MSHA biogenesis protein MshI [Aeromonas simiae]MDO2953026.1 MSHA biogenesis protein MshI [Aeromonas simiae]MDO2954853.1 MSHA biogenesis protein MshI [Aeromonas simiae]